MFVELTEGVGFPNKYIRLLKLTWPNIAGSSHSPRPLYHGNCRSPVKAEGPWQSIAPSVSPW